MLPVSNLACDAFARAWLLPDDFGPDRGQPARLQEPPHRPGRLLAVLAALRLAARARTA